VLSLTAHTAALLGAERDIADRLGRLDDAGSRFAFYIGDEARARAWCDVARGRTATAVGRLQGAAETVLASGRPYRALYLLHDLVRLGHAKAAVDPLTELAANGEGILISACADHARAAVAEDVDGLLAVGEMFATVGARLLEAEAFAQAAAVADRTGHRMAAATATARSRTAIAECPGVTTPALSLSGPAATLTRREQEIAALAARGMTDREIADELIVSVRTVQTHLYNAYAKLGIDGRGDLAAVISAAD
jgi:DNA-binding CsgD family transcriptional regulator